MKISENIPVSHLKDSIQEPDLSGNFNIREICQILGHRNMVQPLHRHSFYYLLVLKQGAGEHFIDFVSYTIQDYSIFLMRPGQVHQIKLNSGSSGYIIGFSSSFYEPLLHASRSILLQTSNQNHYQLDQESFRKIFHLTHHLFEEFTHKQKHYYEAIQAYLAAFFIELFRQIMPDQNSRTNVLHHEEQLYTLSELIEKNITRYKQVSDYAELMNLSIYQLNHITKSVMGKTCSQLINEHVMLEAKRLLLATSKQVNQIAFELGYEDTSYFIRFFKKHTGLSPESFRKHLK